MVYNILLNAGNYSNAQQSTTAGGIAGAFGAFFAGLTLLYIVILLLPIVIALTIRIIYGFITFSSKLVVLQISSFASWLTEFFPYALLYIIPPQL